MISYIGFGSNVGNRLKNLEEALAQLKSNTDFRLQAVSPVFETEPLLPLGAPPSWRKSYLNSVIQIDWLGSATDLLKFLKLTEQNMGRKSAERWAPRIVDLDILSFGDEVLASELLTIPHPELSKRQFVLSALKHLCPQWKPPGVEQTILELSRTLSGAEPLFMGVVNLTPDSFSDCGATIALEKWDEVHVGILDLGGESTRPGALAVDTNEEWNRLKPALENIRRRYSGRHFRPWISVDTFHLETAKRAVEEYQVDMINDVSGLNDLAFLDWLAEVPTQYVLMHSLTVPADSSKTLVTSEPTKEIKSWALEKLAQLETSGVNLSRVIFDPGIGFGKTSEQSSEIIQNISEFFELPVRLMVGHSRKSYLDPQVKRAPQERDPESIGVSLRLAQKGVDLLRVHNPEIHSRAFRAFQAGG